ncbi:hypothetical protein CDAR_516631 [Caerostris darwini]|uniref:Uncharacterized protein n=1 Tax=Caerostris darwini TaxID=1538125 RepID=A0AAV4WTD4_9ARAC|nr:hypothetical protein CDAR_516631 [Caerostris darwini]
MDDFSDNGDNISDNKEDDDVEKDYIDLSDNDMGESNKILIYAEMHIIRSSNRKRMRKWKDFSYNENNISDNEEDNVVNENVTNDYADLIDNDMDESNEILIEAEMHITHSINRKRVRVIIFR